MKAYIIRRLLLTIPTLFILTILVFLSVRFIPGDVIDVMAGRADWWEGGVDREAIERRLGLDLPVHVQYGRWIDGILLRGTLGESLMGGWRIEQRMLGRLPVTAELGLLAILIGLVIALPVGIYSAVRQYTAADYVGRSVAIMGLATPNFWLGTMVMIYPAIWWAWSPPMELIPLAQDPLGNLGMFLIPSLILGTYLAASTMRMTRTMMLEVLRQDYIRTAWAKGLLERSVILRHAVKNAIIPVVTLVGRRHRHPDPGAGEHLRRFAGALSLRGDPPARPSAGPLGPVSAGHRPRGARPAEPPHPQGAAVADGGADRHRPQRRGGGADRRHHRLHRRSAGPGDAALRRRLDGVSGAAVAAHHHVDCRPRHGADHHRAGGVGRHPGLARGARRGAGGQGERLLPVVAYGRSALY